MRRLLLCVVPLVLVGCVSAHDLGNGRVEVPRTAEVRSPFGTNITYGKLENCARILGPNRTTKEFADCFTVIDWQMVSSQGQGGQIAAGALNAIGLGVLGAVMPSNGAGVMQQSQSLSVTAPKGHR